MTTDPVISRRALLVIMAGTALHRATARPVQQNYPGRRITFVVPFAAGGGPDLLGRVQAAELATVLGVDVTVENRVGAGGTVAANAVAQASPDGYTVILGASSHLINKLTTPSLPFDPIADFEHVSLCWRSVAVLVVPAVSPYQSAIELAAAMRARPAAFSYASGGVGTVAHLAGGAYTSVLGLRAVHVPYRGSVDIVPALLRGDVQFAFPIASTAMPAIAAGQVRALAVTGSARLGALPGVPTLLELYAQPLLVQEAWGGLWLPRGTPVGIVARLFAANETVIRTPSLKKRFETNGVEPTLSESPATFSAFIAAENRKWRNVLALLGLLPS
jgi:tripartite-type tricarboxylate transporter receptor subunit TctC